MKKEDLMAVIEGRITQCQMCPLGLLRKNTVPGEGNLYSPILFVGEGPGEEEDNQGRPFVGKAGQLLTKILESVNIAREDVYIANMVKCRPPNNRVPTSLEIQSCSQYLLAQIEVINPRMIVPLGSTVVEFLFRRRSTDNKSSRERIHLERKHNNLSDVSSKLSIKKSIERKGKPKRSNVARYKEGKKVLR